MSRKSRRSARRAPAEEQTPPVEATAAEQVATEEVEQAGESKPQLDLAAIAARLSARQAEDGDGEPAPEAERTTEAAEATEATETAEPAETAEGAAEAGEADPTDQTDPTEPSDHQSADEAPAAEAAQDEGPEVVVSEAQLSGAEIFAAIEALLFAADRPLTPAQIARALPSGIGAKEVRRQLAAIVEALADSERGFELREIAGGWQLVSREKYAPYVQRLRRSTSIKKLSGSALETLAVVAYKQPVGRAEIERIRGVNAGEMLRSLLEKRLIRIAGRSEQLGNALLYGTTQDFLEHFGLNSIADLPRSAELSRKPAAKQAAEAEGQSQQRSAAESIGLANWAPGQQIAPAAHETQADGEAPAATAAEPADSTDSTDQSDPSDREETPAQS